jgi:dipeptidase
VAIRTKLWDPATADKKPFNFGWIYGNDRMSTGFACTRRVWRVFTLAAPSLLSSFSPYTDGLGTFGFGHDGLQPYPFSVKPDVPLTVQDIMNMNRDQYEGSAFDLTKGADGGKNSRHLNHSTNTHVKTCRRLPQGPQWPCYRLILYRIALTPVKTKQLPTTF